MFVEIVEILIVHNHCVIGLTSFCNRDITNYDCYVTYHTCDLKVVVVVWFGDPCESPGALLLKAAPEDLKVKSNKILIEINSSYHLNMMNDTLGLSYTTYNYYKYYLIS